MINWLWWLFVWMKFYWEKEGNLEQAFKNGDYEGLMYNFVQGLKISWSVVKVRCSRAGLLEYFWAYKK